MSGATGTLNVYINGQNGTMTKIWTLAGDQDSKWINGHAPIASREDYQVTLLFCRHSLTKLKRCVKSSHQEVLYKKVYLENSQNSLENTCARVSVLIRLHDWQLL